MPVIRFVKAYSPLEVAAGDNLMASLLKAGLPVASSCGSEGVCAKCGIKVVQGSENLSPPNPTEIFLKEKNGLPKDLRISCQTQVYGDILIDAGYW
jgi:ferredoxin